MSPRSSFHPSTFQPFLLSTLPLHFTAQLLHRATPNTLPNSTITPLSHLVGYQNKAAAKEGWNLICGTFEKVDGSAMTLADAKPNAAFTWMSYDTIQFLDHGGGTRVREDGYPAVYSYFTTSDGAPADGWYQMDYAMMGMFVEAEDADNVLKAGDAIVVQTVDKAAGLQFKAALPADAE